jgi:DNA-binding NarL/FixJ family response regulator
VSLRVVVVDDAYLVREGLARLLGDGDEVEVVASVGEPTAALAACEHDDVDALVTDIRMPPTHTTEGIELALTVRERRPDLGVVVLSQHVGGAYAFELFAHGTAGIAYLLKERVADRDELLRALHTTIAGGSVIDPLVVDHLLGRERRQRTSPLRDLTEREADVLALMAQGRTNPAIAATLFVSESAVSKHIAAIFSKLGLAEGQQVDRRVSAVLTYLRDADPH